MQLTQNDIMNAFNKWFDIKRTVQKVGYSRSADKADDTTKKYMNKLYYLMEDMESHYSALANKKYPEPKVRGMEHAEWSYNVDTYIASKYLYVYNKIIALNPTFNKMYKKYLEEEKLREIMQDFV